MKNSLRLAASLSLLVTLTGLPLRAQSVLTSSGYTLLDGENLSADFILASGAYFNAQGPSDVATVSGVLSGSGDLSIISSGTVILTGVNTYTGGTRVTNAGILLARGQTNDPGVGRPYSSTGSGAVTVASGGALGGSGYIDGLVTVEHGGTLTFGSTGDILTLAGGLTLATGAILDYQLGAAHDFLAVDNGLLTSTAGTGGVTINLDYATGFTAGNYTLLTFFTDGGTTTTDLDLHDFALGDTFAGYDFTLFMSGRTLQLSATAIPEPSTYAALAGALALGLAAWRRSARKSCDYCPKKPERNTPA